MLFLFKTIFINICQKKLYLHVLGNSPSEDLDQHDLPDGCPDDV